MASECEFFRLTELLESLDVEVTNWRLHASAAAMHGQSLDVRTAIIEKVNKWFLASVDPLICELRSAAVRPEVLRVSECISSAAQDMRTEVDWFEPV